MHHPYGSVLKQVVEHYFLLRCWHLRSVVGRASQGTQLVNIEKTYLEYLFSLLDLPIVDVFSILLNRARL